MKRLLKYGILSALIFFPGFSGAKLVTNHIEMTYGTFDGAVSSCQSKGAGWDLAYAISGSWDFVNNPKYTGWVKNTPSSLAAYKCWYDPFLEDHKGAAVDGDNGCVGDLPKSNSFPGICTGQKCTYTAGFSAWGACNPATGLQVTINPFYNTVYGPTCTDIVAPIRACGVCNATTVATPTSTSPTNLCAFGAPTVPIRSGASWVWSCNMVTGVNASCAAPYVAPPSMTMVDAVCDPDGLHAEIKWSGINLSTYAVRYNNGINPWHPNSCTDINPGDVCLNTTATSMRVTATPGRPNTLWVHAFGGSTWSNPMIKEFTCPLPGPVAPIVDLRADPAVVNLNNGTSTVSPSKAVDLKWNITNAATACVGGCVCEASNAWEGPKTYPDPGDTNDGVVGIDDPTFTLTCRNAVNGAQGSDSVTVVSSCDQVSWYDSNCSANCGDAEKKCYQINENCTPSSCDGQPCDLPDCPVSGEWKEVAN